MIRLGILVFMACVLTACSSLQPRAATSSYGCMQAVRAQIPANEDDKRLHCVTSAAIAQQCSITEAYLAGIGKELGDLLGRGDPEWADWQADRAGVSCGRSEVGAAAIETCCAAKGH